MVGCSVLLSLYLVHSNSKDSKHKAWTKGFEGLSLIPYADTTGHNTIGYGHLNREGLKAITVAQAEALFEHDYLRARAGALAIKGAENLDSTRLAALTDMVFNMGFNSVNDFKDMTKALREEKWCKVYTAAVDSKWYKQVPERARQVSEVLAFGDEDNIKPHERVLVYDRGKVTGSIANEWKREYY